MTWDTIWNIAKLVGYLSGAILLIVTITKIVSSTGKDNLIKILQDELAVARPTVIHYREEMHAVRQECGAKVFAAELELKEALEKSKVVEIENAKLRSMTDLSPVMETISEFIFEQRSFMTDQRTFVKAQSDINAQMLTTLQELTKKVIGDGA